MADKDKENGETAADRAGGADKAGEYIRWSSSSVLACEAAWQGVLERRCRETLRIAGTVSHCSAAHAQVGLWLWQGQPKQHLAMKWTSRISPSLRPARSWRHAPNSSHGMAPPFWPLLSGHL